MKTRFIYLYFIILLFIFQFSKKNTWYYYTINTVTGTTTINTRNPGNPVIMPFQAF